ncbi:NAD(P)/FAD-dependent oxidoreductase [Ruixingdingia sedimenti]|uniref:FAD-dependent oxidoreductase n=1 Tax=Ruixingdingia sedimenti TaxID=3073604 RepID=A0ABU1F2C0_9RHOB|nr:FAD-dependent oxidoreductase [Xinfangfangia sp. LG-4]MDR5651000.1 FAD-dependent oxidoreductase [Xinfangfangia sp. LG-4]
MGGIVVIGAGQAGAALAARLRALKYAGPVTLIGAEPAAPYQRPPLSKAYLLGETDLDRLLLRNADFWDAQNIDLRPNAEVTGIDRAAKCVVLGGERIPYDQLALTTGAVVRRLPPAIGGDLAGIHYMRTLADADRLAPELVAGRRVLIVGGGYIGLEAAAVAAKRGLQVTLVEAAPRILQRVAAPETSDWFRALHLAHGVRIVEGVGLDRLVGTGHVSGAVLANGEEIAVDFVIAGVGILPDTGLAEAAGLALDNGIRVDGQGRTSDPAIWAAGDCASFPYAGGRIRLESVQNAIDQAECVAANMLGAGKDYLPYPWFWSDQYDVKLQIAGLNTGYDRVVVRDEGAARAHWYYRAGRLIAVDAMNDPRAFMVAKRLLAAGRSADPAKVADPAVELKTLLA